MGYPYESEMVTNTTLMQRICIYKYQRRTHKYMQTNTGGPFKTANGRALKLCAEGSEFKSQFGKGFFQSKTFFP